MTKKLEEVVADLRLLPEDEQDHAASVLADSCSSCRRMYWWPEALHRDLRNGDACADSGCPLFAALELIEQLREVRRKGCPNHVVAVSTQERTDRVQDGVAAADIGRAKMSREPKPHRHGRSLHPHVRDESRSVPQYDSLTLSGTVPNHCVSSRA
jgi:hypothetical protein